jgi:hypothetical protein
MFNYRSRWRNPYDHIGGENANRKRRREKSSKQTFAKHDFLSSNKRDGTAKSRHRKEMLFNLLFILLGREA